SLRGLSVDDRILTLRKLNEDPAGWLRWEIGTNVTTPGTDITNTSPDGRWIIRRTLSSDNRPQYQIRAAPGAEADWRDLVSITRPQPVGTLIYSADSNWLLYHDQDSDGQEGLYRTPIGGGKPERLGDMPTNQAGVWIAISPDGRSVLAWGRPKE